MTDYFDRLELELRGAVARTTVAPQSRRRRRPISVSGIAMTLAGGAALATAVAMIAVLGHGRRHPLPQARPAVTGALGVVAVRPCYSASSPRCLIAQHAVLQRPQTEAERRIRVPLDPSIFFAGQALREVHITAVPRLTRLVRLGAGRTVVLFVVKVSIGPPSYYLGAIVTINGRSHTFAVDWPVIPTRPGLNHTATWGIFASLPHWFSGYDVSIVPDPVARVRWTYGHPNGAPSRTISAQVLDNVAAAPAPARPAPDVNGFDTYGRVVAGLTQPVVPVRLPANAPGP
jgi:hypothetical protein